MIDTRRLARLIAHADRADAKVVLVGDPHQLPEIGAGGAFTAPPSHAPRGRARRASPPNRPHRPRSPRRPARRHAESAVQRLVANGRVALVDTVDAARQQMDRDWLAAQRNGTDTVMLAARRADVEDLNQRARTHLVDAGVVQSRGIVVNGREFAVGDRVMALNNRRRLGITNGDRGTVITIGGKEELVDASTEARPSLFPPATYGPRHLMHAYAMTIHKAQGMTCDQALVLANHALFREAGYTALSRGRKENRLYVVEPNVPDIDIGHGIYGDTDHPLDASSRRSSNHERNTSPLSNSCTGRPSSRQPPDEASTCSTQTQSEQLWHGRPGRLVRRVMTTDRLIHG